MYDVTLLTSNFDYLRVAEPIGVCFLAAALRERGFSVKIIEPSVEGQSVKETAKAVLSTPSKLLGISAHADKDKEKLLEFLKTVRQGARDRFICIGGHGPSVELMTKRCSPTSFTRIRYEEIGHYADALMIGESEVSFPQLVERVLAGQDWQHVPGAAYLENGALHINPPPPKIEDLDTIPFMARDVLEQYLQKYDFPPPASLSFGRGCLHRCAFCTAREFESLQPGERHRQRSVESIIAEIKHLHGEYAITQFNFEDDNFIVKNKRGIQKLHSLCEAILQLDFKISFTVSCRADTAEKDLFMHLKEAGLTGIYFGIESVYEPDLVFFHKMCKLAQIQKALNTFMGLGYSLGLGSPQFLKIGYITWHPLSNFSQLRASARFARTHKMSPKLLRRSLRLYAGAPIGDQIEALGLLDEDSVDGWTYKNPRLRRLQVLISDYFRTVNDVRDRIRTAEKVVQLRDREDVTLLDLTGIRAELDAGCFDYFDELINIGEANMDGDFDEVVERFDNEKRAELFAYLEEKDVLRKINDVLATLELPSNPRNFFRR